MATMNQVQAAMHSQPCRALTVHRDDGSSYLIKHLDFISYSLDNRELTVHDELGVHFIDLSDFSEIHVLQLPAGVSPRRG